MLKSFNKEEKQLTFKLYASLIAWIVLSFALILFISYLTDRSSNDIAKWISLRLDLLYTLYLVLGFSGIVYYYWRMLIVDIHEIKKGIKDTYEGDSCSISLPASLHDVEMRLNTIKQTLTKSEQNVAIAERKKDELVMHLAHDIRTPLTTVIGYLNLLKETPNIPEEQRDKYLSIALTKSERLEVLINELFDLTRYNAKSVVLNKSTVNLSYMISQIADEFYPSSSLNENDVRLSLDERLTANVDADKIVRALSNIFKNAISYSDVNTSIEISATPENGDAVIVFKNIGDTIAPEDLASMFEKFNRLDKARTSDTGGTGLGLPIAKDIIELHGGTINAQSENRTIIITVRLPLC